ncbi:hypothetical protein F1188_17785 [Roseospira marina]|uniref:Uncharacterized protein n=1 Tax=Roseospira marina TaxID=140057 RepID=A0A5M6I7D6_9PROT|nr:hypothetical protein [Roseospira marina]KAA5604043.1 hypothetical protein F1188_17785 [Roseospira marina]MBB4315837.1 hypothetical protein [Roseospira marina]MBB5089023.1 hypothetical protein [Roseospira marina]
MTKILTYHVGSMPFRVQKQQCVPLFVLRDLCRILGFSGEADALRYLRDHADDPDDVVTGWIHDPAEPAESPFVAVALCSVFALSCAPNAVGANRFETVLVTEAMPVLFHMRIKEAVR